MRERIKMAKKVINKTKGKAVVSPAGSALWTKVITPDTQFDRNGSYETSLVLDPADEKTSIFLNSLEALSAQAVKEVKENLGDKGNTLKVFPITKDELTKDGEPTGNIVIKAKLKAKDYEFKDQKVDVYDVRGRKEDNWSTDIGNGSTIKIGAFAFPYYMAKDNVVGISLKLNKIQVIELVEYENDGGFGDESGEAGFGDTTETFKDNNADF